MYMQLLFRYLDVYGQFHAEVQGKTLAQQTAVAETDARKEIQSHARLCQGRLINTSLALLTTNPMSKIWRLLLRTGKSGGLW